MKLSKKQKEVLQLMKDYNSKIVFVGAYPKSFCFMEHNLSYRIGLPTFFALEESGYIERKGKEYIYTLVADKK